jgi:hypothetical protein
MYCDLDLAFTSLICPKQLKRGPQQLPPPFSNVYSYEQENRSHGNISANHVVLDPPKPLQMIPMQSKNDASNRLYTATKQLHYLSDEDDDDDFDAFDDDYETNEDIMNFGVLNELGRQKRENRTKRRIANPFDGMSTQSMFVILLVSMIVNILLTIGLLLVPYTSRS